jgi:hypothetical protein
VRKERGSPVYRSKRIFKSYVKDINTAEKKIVPTKNILMGYEKISPQNKNDISPEVSLKSIVKTRTLNYLPLIHLLRCSDNFIHEDFELLSTLLGRKFSLGV